MTKSSLRTRFAFSVGSNLFRALLSFITGMLLGRFLGPENYGNMSFLIGTFMGVRQLLDMGSSTAFFTFVSQKTPTKKFVFSFFAWLLIQFLIPVIIIGIFFPIQWVHSIWHNNERFVVLLAFLATFMQNSVWPILQNSGESQRQTHWVQGIGVIVSITHLIAVVLLWQLGKLGIYAIFIAIAIEYILASILANKKFKYSLETQPSESPKALLRKYLIFCLPMIPYSILNFIFEFVDKWMLQSNGGSIQQAYFAIGMQLCSIALIATTSIIRIFWKEIAEANYNGDKERMGVLYLKVSRFLFLVGSIIAGFLMPWTKEILNLILGSAYVGGAATLTIMFFYPIHQSLGQINGTLLLATEKVKLQVICGIIFMITSIIASYFILASKEATIPGLGLGSIGLALKMVTMQFLEVNTISYIISRVFKWHFNWTYQFICIIGCSFIGWITYFSTTWLVGNSLPILLEICFSGGMYLFLIGSLIYYKPQLAGITREEIIKTKHLIFRGVFK